MIWNWFLCRILREIIVSVPHWGWPAGLDWLHWKGRVQVQFPLAGAGVTGSPHWENLIQNSFNCTSRTHVSGDSTEIYPNIFCQIDWNIKNYLEIFNISIRFTILGVRKYFVCIGYLGVIVLAVSVCESVCNQTWYSGHNTWLPLLTILPHPRVQPPPPLPSPPSGPAPVVRTMWGPTLPLPGPEAGLVKYFLLEENIRECFIKIFRNI